MLHSKNVEAVIKSNSGFFFSQVKKEKKKYQATSEI